MNLKNSGVYSLEELVRRFGKQPRGNGARGLSCEQVEALTSTGGGTPSQSGRHEPPPVSAAGERGQQPYEKTGTLAFPGPPRAAEDGTRGPDPRGARPDTSVTMHACQAIPIRAVNQATQIFVLSPAPSPVRDAKPSGAENGRARAHAAPPFSPVPNAKPDGRARERAQSYAGPPLSPVPSPAGLARSAALPSGEASERAQTFKVPLLRAFDVGKRGEATWTTAKTITTPVMQVEPGEKSTNAQVGPGERDEVRSSHLPSPRRVLGNLRQFSAVTKKISALVLAAAVVAGVGTLLARSVAEGMVPGRVSPGAASSVPSGAQPAAALPPVPTGAHVESRASVEATTDPPNSPLTDSNAPLAEATPPEPSTRRTPVSKVAHGKLSNVRPSAGLDSSASKEVTLARQAVDALLAGDRAKALLHYRELSRTAPERAVYREAVRLLTPAASDMPR